MFDNIKERELKIPEIFNLAGMMFKKSVKTIGLLMLTMLGVAVAFGTVGFAMLLLIDVADSMALWLGMGVAVVLIYLASSTIVNMAMTNISLKLLAQEEVISLRVILPSGKTVVKGMLAALPILISGMPVVVILFNFGLLYLAYGTAEFSANETYILMFFTILTMYLIILLTFRNHVIAHQGKGAWSVLKECMSLLKGRFLKTLVFLVLTALFSAIPSLLMNVSYQMSSMMGALYNMVIWILGIFISYYIMMATAVWYLNRYYTTGKLGQENNDNN